jgi:hypothetical protein
MKPSTATRVVRNRLGSILGGYRSILAFAPNDRPGKGHRGVGGTEHFIIIIAAGSEDVTRPTCRLDQALPVVVC